MPKGRKSLLFLAVLLLAAGCGGSPPAATPSPSGASPAVATPQAEAALPSSRLELRSRAQGLQANLVSSPSGPRWRLYDAADHPVADFQVESDRVKVRDGKDRVLFKVKRKPEGWELEDGSGRRLLRAKPKDGGWKIRGDQEAAVARVRLEGPSARLEDGQGRLIARARPGAGEVVLSDASGQEAAVLRGTANPQVALWFMMPGLDPVAQAGLAVYTLEVR